MSTIALRLHVWCATLLATALDLWVNADAVGARRAAPADHGSASVRDRGQATTEYALVLLGAAVVALLVVAWATAGGGAGKIGRLFDRVIDAVSSKI